MDRLKTNTDLEFIGQLNHKCPRCIRGYLILDGSGSLSCLNCGYTADLVTGDSKRRSKKVPLYLSGEERKKESGRVAKNSTRLSTLSPKEREVLDLASRGYKNRGIADLLGWQVGSVDGYMTRIFSKLELNDSVNKRATAIRIWLAGNV